MAFHRASADAACALWEKWKQSGAKKVRSTAPSGVRGMMVWSKNGCSTTVKSSLLSYLSRESLRYSFTQFIKGFSIDQTLFSIPWTWDPAPGERYIPSEVPSEHTKLFHRCNNVVSTSKRCCVLTGHYPKYGFLGVQANKKVIIDFKRW